MSPSIAATNYDVTDDKKKQQDEFEDVVLEICDAKKDAKDEKDAWAIDWNDHEPKGPKWDEMTSRAKAKSVATVITKITLALGCLYLFICSIGLLGDAFQILAGKTAGEVFSNSTFLSNPVTGLIIGILVSVLVQSSSTSTSIVVTMVAAGILPVDDAIYIIMGCNIGTSVTNTIVALSQSVDREQFRRAFGGATVLDIFNILTVLVLLPLEVASGYLEVLSKAVIDASNLSGGSEEVEFLTVITDPFVHSFVVVNKSVITFVAQGIELEPEASMIKIWCEQKAANVTINGTMEEVVVGVKKCDSPSDFLFANTGLSDVVSGVILLVVSLFLLCFCLIVLVKLLSSMLQGGVAVVIKKVINTDFPRPFGWLAGYLAILVGAGLTFLVQSSSVFTSTMTPLVGMGVISMDRMYPLTLGSNIGTTTTGLLAALASDPDTIQYSLQIALVHLFFNLTGVLLWYPVPIMRRVPIRGAKYLGNTTASYKWFAVFYLLAVFFVVPVVLLALTFAGTWVMLGVLIAVLVVIATVVAMNVMMTYKPTWLPLRLRTWEFLPAPMRSLQPYDSFMSKYLMCRCCCRKDHADELESVTSPSLTTTSSSNHVMGETNEAYEGTML